MTACYRTLAATLLWITCLFLPTSALRAQDAGEGELSGTVTNEAGEPMPGVLVDVWTWHPGDETHTDAQGYYLLKKLGRDPVEIRFSKEGYDPWYNPAQPTGIAGLNVTLSNKTYFEGDVKDPNGKPVPNALVRADCGPKRNPGVYITTVWTETHTDANGHYRLYVAPDTYEIQMRVPKVGAARLPKTPIAANETKTLDINLEKGVTFQALIVDSQTHAPLPGVRLWHWEHKGIEGTSDQDGKLTIDGMQPGKFEFDVKAKGYVRWWSAEAVNDYQRKDLRGSFQRNFDSLDFDLVNDMAPVTIEVEKAVTIKGVVQDPDGKPVAGATVAPAHTGTGNSITGDTRFSFTTRKDGTFTMTLPASGNAKYNLEAHDGKYGQWRKWANGVLDPIQTNPGDVLNDVVIKLTRPAVVRGHVHNAAGDPVPHVEVRAQAVDKLENRYYDPTTETDKDGNFELKFVRPGDQSIEVAPFWFEGAPPKSRASVTLKEGEVKDGVDLESQPERPSSDTPNKGGL